MSRQLLDHLAAVCERNAGRNFLFDVASERDFSFDEFLDGSLRAASFLAANGVTRGCRICFSMENCVELALLYFGSMHLGAIIVPINPALHQKDFAYVLERTEPKLCICDMHSLPRFENASVPVLLLADAPNSASGPQFGLVDILSETPFAGGAFRIPQDEDVIARMYSSGSTGRPKGIDIAYRGLIGNGLAFGQRHHIGQENKFINVLPMTYLGGFYNLLLLPLVNESSVVLDSVFGPSNLFSFWDTVLLREVNTPWFTAAMLSMLLSRPPDEDISRIKEQVRFGLVGMAPVPPHVKTRFEETFGFRLYENYALSETTFLTSNHEGLAYKAGSCGTALPGVTVEIVGSDGALLPAMAAGQIRVRTPYFMRDYADCADADRDTVTPQGFLTGDLGYVDGDGELFVTGRIKDLIIRGGINISPKAIEGVMYEIPNIEEVAVFGVPHEIYGEEVMAAFTRKRGSTLTVEEVRAYCSKHIALFQQPKKVHLLDAMPKGSTGKLDRNAARRIAMALDGEAK